MEIHRQAGFRDVNIIKSRVGRKRKPSEFEGPTVFVGVPSEEFKRQATFKVEPVPRARNIQLVDASLSEERKDMGLFNIQGLLQTIAAVQLAGTAKTPKGVKTIAEAISKLPSILFWSASQRKDIEVMLSNIKGEFTSEVLKKAGVVPAGVPVARLGPAERKELMEGPDAPEVVPMRMEEKEAEEEEAVAEDEPMPDVGALPAAPPPAALIPKDEPPDVDIPRRSQRQAEGEEKRTVGESIRLRKLVTANGNSVDITNKAFLLDKDNSLLFAKWAMTFQGPLADRTKKFFNENGFGITQEAVMTGIKKGLHFRMTRRRLFEPGSLPPSRSERPARPSEVGRAIREKRVMERRGHLPLPLEEIESGIVRSQLRATPPRQPAIRRERAPVLREIEEARGTPKKRKKKRT